jgi:N-formylglutamate amidohydrolase
MADAAAHSDPQFLPPGRRFTPDELVFYADPDDRDLGDALAEADLLVSTPHAGSLIPGELAGLLAPGLTKRLQFDFTDLATGPVARAWARTDRRIVYVENPHPRLVRDPNRDKPADLAATLGEAFARVAAAGPGHRVDLSGVDAIRPVMFNFMPLLTPPAGQEELTRMAKAFAAAADQGLGVYERTRDDLVSRMLEAKLKRARDTGAPAALFTLSFHDTMNHTATPDGAVATERAPADRLPGVVALSNRGDAQGEPRAAEPVTMHPELIRRLAQAHREGFAVTDPSHVALNQPYLGSYEVTTFGALFRETASDAEAAGLTLGAVQAEFRREYLLGDQATADLLRPGTDWPTPPASHTRQLAACMQRSWDVFRAALGETLPSA